MSLQLSRNGEEVVFGAFKGDRELPQGDAAHLGKELVPFDNGEGGEVRNTLAGAFYVGFLTGPYFVEGVLFIGGGGEKFKLGGVEPAVSYFHVVAVGVKDLYICADIYTAGNDTVDVFGVGDGKGKFAVGKERLSEFALYDAVIGIIGKASAVGGQLYSRVGGYIYNRNVACVLVFRVVHTVFGFGAEMGKGDGTDVILILTKQFFVVKY